MALPPNQVATIRATLAESPLFSELAGFALDTLAACAEPITIRGGETLFAVGDQPQAFYLVAAGRMRAVLSTGQVAGEIGRLEPLGEIGVISGERRTANAVALRDSLLYRFSREAFHAFIVDHPAALLAITKVLITRLRQNARDAELQALRQTRTFAVVAGVPGIEVSVLVRDLTERLAATGAKVCCVTAEMVDADFGPGLSATPSVPGPADTALLEWLNRLEASHDYLVYDTIGSPEWYHRALHQADRVLVYGAANRVPDPAAVARFNESRVRVPVDVVLQRSALANATLQWVTSFHATGHYFLRSGQVGDLHSLVRQLTGHGVGLVLGGGGARGFAHIGLLRALDELQLPIDLVGGTSMGALISALFASGYGWKHITEIVRDTFVTRNLLSDYLFPRVALIEGKKLRRRLYEIFGDAQVEQLPMPYFCVTTNLTRGTPMVHESGPLAAWVGTSMCIPGVAPPVAYKGDLLADGAVVNSLPTDVMQGYGRGSIIASDVSTAGALAAPGVEGPDFEAVFKRDAEGKRVNLIDILFCVSTLTSESGVKARAARADLYLRMPVAGIDTFGWKGIDSIIDLGYRHAMSELPAVLHKLKHEKN